MKIQTIRHLILGLLTLLSGYIYVIANTTLPEKIIIKKPPLIKIQSEEKDTLLYLNKLRTKAGLIPLKSNKILNISAKNHAKYLIFNHKIGHFEDIKHKEYTGQYGAQRAIHRGYKTSLIIENVSSNNPNYKESVDGLMGAIYHRFGFLDFHINEIGIGILQDKENPNSTAFVYDMGNSELNNLCKNPSKENNKNTLEKICANQKIKLSPKKFFSAINSNVFHNHAMITYPFDGQKDIPPAFYEELPDPLPEYSVSGFPISLSFDEAQFKSVEILSFKLYNDNKEINETILYNKESDPNHKLKKFEFALFPLKRLDWDTKYTVKSTYKTNGRIHNHTWSFTTRSFVEPVYAVTTTNHHFKLTEGKSAIFYFPPHSKRDILHSLRYPRNLDISFIDKNTIRITAQHHFKEKIILRMGRHRLVLESKNS